MGERRDLSFSKNFAAGCPVWPPSVAKIRESAAEVSPRCFQDFHNFTTVAGSFGGIDSFPSSGLRKDSE